MCGASRRWRRAGRGPEVGSAQGWPRCQAGGLGWGVGNGLRVTPAPPAPSLLLLRLPGAPRGPAGWLRPPPRSRCPRGERKETFTRSVQGPAFPGLVASPTLQTPSPRWKPRGSKEAAGFVWGGGRDRSPWGIWPSPGEGVPWKCGLPDYWTWNDWLWSRPTFLYWLSGRILLYPVLNHIIVPMSILSIQEFEVSPGVPGTQEISLIFSVPLPVPTFTWPRKNLTLPMQDEDKLY